MPDPPASASLDVLGPDTVEVSFTKPLSDGGAPVTSYVVSEINKKSIFTILLSVIYQ